MAAGCGSNFNEFSGTTTVQMNTHGLWKDARAETIGEKLGVSTACGQLRFQQLLSRPLETNADRLRDHQKTILAYRNQPAATLARNEAHFRVLREIEPALASFHQPSSLEKEAVEQILFSGNQHLQILNSVPYLLALVSIWKQYVVPALAICLPVLFFLLPFAAMRWIYGLPIEFHQYIEIFCKTMGIPSSFNKLEMKQTAQLLVTSISLGQSIYHPVQTSFHIQKIDTEIQSKTKAFLQFKEIFSDFFPSSSYLFEDLPAEDTRRSFADLWDFSFKLRYALDMVGDVEVIHRFAVHPNIRPVSFEAGRSVCMKQLLDPLLESKSIPVSFFFSKQKQHSLLTGPNGGGKSSALRCILVNILLAQTLGIYFGTETAECRLHPFDWIQSGLHLEDTPGELSLFEREVQFASSAIQRAKSNPTQRGLLLFDELFHSTNPPDGERTATVFLEQVWSCPTLSSIISTHVFSLAEKAPSHVQTLCVPAHKDLDGRLTFTYTLQPGICKVSSVDRILQECGFFPPGKPEIEKE